MKTQLELKVTTEKSMTTIAKLLLILNRKQLQVNKLQVGEKENLYKYIVKISGEERNIQHSVKLIAKQVGVYNASIHPVAIKKKQQAIIM